MNKRVQHPHKNNFENKLKRVPYFGSYPSWVRTQAQSITVLTNNVKTKNNSKTKWVGWRFSSVSRMFAGTHKALSLTPSTSRTRGGDVCLQSQYLASRSRKMRNWRSSLAVCQASLGDIRPCSKNKPQTRSYRSYRDGSVVKNNHCFADGMGLVPHTHLTAHSCLLSPVAENPRPSSDLGGHQSCTRCTYRHVSKHSYTCNKNKSLKTLKFYFKS